MSACLEYLGGTDEDSLSSRPWRSIWWQTSRQQERSWKKIFLGIFRVCLCQQSATNVSSEKEPPAGLALARRFTGTRCFCSDRFLLPPRSNTPAASRTPHSTRSVSEPYIHVMRRSPGKGFLFQRPHGRREPRASLRSLAQAEPGRALPAQPQSLSRPWQESLPSLALSLPLPFDVSPVFQPLLDSKCNHIAHKVLWKAPFLMIWQPLDTERPSRKNFNPSSHSFRKPR